MSILSRYLDTSEARREAENLQHNFDGLVRDNAELIGKNRRLEADNGRLVSENRKLRREVSALTDAAGGEMRRVLESQAYERDRAEKALTQAMVLKADLDAAVIAKQVAERALDAARVPTVDRQEAQDRANNYAQADINAQLRRLAEDLEAQVAELEAELRARVENGSTP